MRSNPLPRIMFFLTWFASWEEFIDKYVPIPFRGLCSFLHNIAEIAQRLHRKFVPIPFRGLCSFLRWSTGKESKTSL